MKKDLITRLNEGPVLCAEGYLFAMERRGYLSAGAFVPEVVLDHPEVLSQLHREFIRSGSEVIQAFTYYGHREKLRIIGKEQLLEPLQKNALQIAKDSRKEFKDLEGFITAHEFMKSPKHLQRFITAQQIGKYIESFKFLADYKEYDGPLYGLYRSLNKYHIDNTNSCWRCEDDIKPIVEEIMKLDIPDDVRYSMKMIDKLEEVIEYSQGLDLLNHVNFGVNARKSIEDFLSLKDKMPDNQQVKLTLTIKNETSNELLSS